MTIHMHQYVRQQDPGDLGGPGRPAVHQKEVHSDGTCTFVATASIWPVDALHDQQTRKECDRECFFQHNTPLFEKLMPLKRNTELPKMAADL